ncbi:Six-hairpin glycosidase, partial [Aureobasidium melanogenum]|uniref:Six-hairpin glycosidase n=1 Tax=Aureobasidium melanogenum (strain CBS 110374) TaxID=1043003 RepID=A0A074W6G7_AURM1
MQPDLVDSSHQLKINSESTGHTELESKLTDGRNIFRHMIDALDVMQSHYFELWIGTWPSAIDWTAAVINTAVSSTLGTVARASSKTDNDRYSRIINKYFSHNAAYYFGEDAFSIRNEAYDDILWTVLEWLENIKTIGYRNTTEPSWHGAQFIPGFSHRARLFWDLASKGWDNDLCGGGMIWNPRLLPYKNTITNQLFISASVAMYLSSPGDSIDFPFLTSESQVFGSMPGRPHDPKYLKAAIEGYSWLKKSNMTNAQGLYVDGYHIKGYSQNGSIGTGKCDDRNEMVYTYNQGVILSGLRGLWEATGNESYLQDGHTLIRDVMASTGWSWSGEPKSPIRKSSSWAGLGQHGILEELCDRSGSCSQDSQTFKGIFFQHLTQFCETLPLKAKIPGKTHSASKSLKDKHSDFCRTVGLWAAHNAEAALSTRNGSGLFGTWWGYEFAAEDYPQSLPARAVDYRNDASILTTSEWTQQGRLQPMPVPDRQTAESNEDVKTADVNDRGRGRTVETQQGGLAVLRSSWELLNSGR